MILSSLQIFLYISFFINVISISNSLMNERQSIRSAYGYDWFSLSL